MKTSFANTFDGDSLSDLNHLSTPPPYTSNMSHWLKRACDFSTSAQHLVPFSVHQQGWIMFLAVHLLHSCRTRLPEGRTNPPLYITLPKITAVQSQSSALFNSSISKSSCILNQILKDCKKLLWTKGLYLLPFLNIFLSQHRLLESLSTSFRNAFFGPKLKKANKQRNKKTPPNQKIITTKKTYS